MRDDQYVVFNLSDVFGLLRRRIFLIGLFAVIGVAGGWAIASALTPSYQASGEIVVKGEASVVADPDRSFGASAVNEAVVTTERDVMVAHGLVERVAAAVVIPPTLLQPGPTHKLIADALDKLREFAQERTGVVGSIVQRLHLAEFLPPPPAPESPQAIVDKRIGFVRGALSTSASKQSSVIGVTATTADAALSTSIVNTMLDFYMQDRVAFQTSVAVNTESVLRTRLESARASTKELEERIADASAKPGMLEGAEVPMQQRQLPIIGSRLAEAQARLASVQADYDSIVALQQAGQNNPAKSLGLVDQGSTSTSDLRRSYLLAVQNLMQLQSRHQANYPGVLEAQQQVNTLAQALSQEVSRLVDQRRAERDAAAATVTALSQQYGQLRASANVRVSSGLSLDRERETLEGLRRSSRLIEDRLLDLAARPMDPSARILSYAREPLAPSFPKKSWFGVAGGLLATCLGIAGTIVFYYLRRLRPSPGKQADGYNANLIGCIPLFSRGPSSRDKIFKALRGGADRTEAGLLAFQSIALECEDIIQRNHICVLAVTSGSHNEGKSTVVTGLGLALADLGLRVLVIDCDMRKPSVLRLLDPGLRPLGSASPAFSRFNIQADTNSGLHVAPLPAGPSLNYLRSAPFAELLGFGRKMYDVVLCDTPPLLAVPDALILAKQADSILLVAENGRHDAESVDEITRRVVSTRTPVCGLVLTKLIASGEVYGEYGRSVTRDKRSQRAITAG